MSQPENLIEDLKYGTIAKKRQAFNELQAIGSSVIPLLVSTAVNASEQDFEWTLEGYDYAQGEGQKYNFNQIEDRDVIQQDYWYMPALTHLLIEFRQDSLPNLIELFTHEKPIIPAWTAFILGEIGDRRAITPLLLRLDTDSSIELGRVCEALGKLKAVDSVRRLIELLDDDKANVDSFVATALGQIGDLRALMPLIKAFKNDKPSIYSLSAALYHFGEYAVIPLTEVLFEPHGERVHDLALIELGMIQDKRAIEPILRYLNNDHDSVSKSRAITTLGNLKAEQAVERIVSLFHNADENIRHSSVRALGYIGGDKAFAILMHELLNSSFENQHSAALAFGDMKSITTLEPLLSAFKEASPKIKSAIAVSLGNLRDKRAIPALTEVLNDPDEETHRYAQLGLDKINGIENV